MTSAQAGLVVGALAGAPLIGEALAIDVSLTAIAAWLAVGAVSVILWFVLRLVNAGEAKTEANTKAIAELVVELVRTKDLLRGERRAADDEISKELRDHCIAAVEKEASVREERKSEDDVLRDEIGALKLRIEVHLAKHA